MFFASPTFGAGLYDNSMSHAIGILKLVRAVITTNMSLNRMVKANVEHRKCCLRLVVGVVHTQHDYVGQCPITAREPPRPVNLLHLADNR